MHKLIRELRRRQVFRAAGLYFGVCWVIIEVAGVVLPELDAPSWVFRTILGFTVAGFPVAMVLAWVYDVAEGKITREEDVPDVVSARYGRQADFVVIGVLVLALGFSVWLNVNDDVQPENMPVLTLLLSDFENLTNDSLFNGSVEQALTIGLEGAPFITAFPREQALRAAASVRKGEEQNLDAETAHLIAVREGVGGVLTGSIEASGSGYKMSAQVIEPQTQTTLAESRAKAQSKLEVLTAVNELAKELRSELGDANVDEQQELFTVGSLEAAKAYVLAQRLHLEGKDDEAIAKYRQATVFDPEFGRAYSGWALSAFRLGRVEESEVQWQKALSYLDRMTERERLRTLGLYYLVVSKNYKKAVENYQELVDKYPADSGGHNNLAIAYFYLREFEKAKIEGGLAMAIYPKELIYKSNFALYAMYASEFATAVAEARKIIAEGEGFHKAYLPLAMAAVDLLDLDAAKDAYKNMAATDGKGASLAAIGLADIAVYEGELELARSILAKGIEADEVEGNSRGAAVKLAALAEVHYELGNTAGAQLAIDKSLDLVRSVAGLVSAASLLVEKGKFESAQELADELGASLRPESRAYGKFIEGQMARLRGEHGTALDLLRTSLELSDIWLAHYELGLVYLEAGYVAEALSEFQLCDQRRGESYAMYLDDVPTVRFTANLSYWLGRSSEDLGLSKDAARNYQRFLASRSSKSDDPNIADAAQRLLQL